MEQFRYRTGVLVGPWRATREDAAADALRAGQASAPEGGGELRWRVDGTIERSSAEAPRGGDDIIGTARSGDPAG
ncbi:MAG TPA: hypothetical protein VEW04_05345 [Allosphingosinicella sp.]|nr:hypothetical protein [Allosphingosinicella sp.]